MDVYAYSYRYKRAAEHLCTFYQKRHAHLNFYWRCSKNRVQSSFKNDVCVLNVSTTDLIPLVFHSRAITLKHFLEEIQKSMRNQKQKGLTCSYVLNPATTILIYISLKNVSLEVNASAQNYCWKE